MSPDIYSMFVGQKVGWRGSLSILTTHECARVQRHCGAILKVDLEALRQVLGVKRNICESQQKSVCIACGKAIGDIVITY